MCVLCMYKLYIYIIYVYIYVKKEAMNLRVRGVHEGGLEWRRKEGNNVIIL